jgi:plasmid stability protein
MSSTLTIRSVDPELKARLRTRAAEHGHSMEEEVRQILRTALLPPVAPRRLGSRIHARFADLGGIELDVPARDDLPSPPDVG